MCIKRIPVWSRTRCSCYSYSRRPTNCLDSAFRIKYLGWRRNLTTCGPWDEREWGDASDEKKNHHNEPHIGSECNQEYWRRSGRFKHLRMVTLEVVVHDERLKGRIKKCLWMNKVWFALFSAIGDCGPQANISVSYEVRTETKSRFLSKKSCKERRTRKHDAPRQGVREKLNASCKPLVSVTDFFSFCTDKKQNPIQWNWNWTDAPERTLSTCTDGQSWVDNVQNSTALKAMRDLLAV